MLAYDVQELIRQHGLEQGVPVEGTRSPLTNVCQAIGRCLTNGSRMDQHPSAAKTEQVLLDYIAWKAQQAQDAHTYS